MIKQLQMGFKLLRYTHGAKSCIVATIVMLVVGAALEWTTLPITETDFNAMQNIGGYFILIAAMWPLQMLISLNVPNVVAVSPWKKRIQTSVFSLTGGVYFLVAYIFAVGIKLIRLAQGKLNEEYFVMEMVGLSLIAVLLLVYMSFCLKYFVLSTVVFCVAVPLLMNFFPLAYYFDWISFAGITPVMSVIIGILAILVSVVLSYGILCLIYKKPISKYSQMNSLKKKM